MSPSCAANTSACTSTCRAAPACLGIGARIGLDFGNTAARDALRALLRLVSLADCKTSLSERQKAALADFVLDDAAFSRGLEAVLNNENVLRPPEAAAVPPQHDSRAAL